MDAVLEVLRPLRCPLYLRQSVFRIVFAFCQDQIKVKEHLIESTKMVSINRLRFSDTDS